MVARQYLDTGYISVSKTQMPAFIKCISSIGIQTIKSESIIHDFKIDIYNEG